MFGFNKQLPVAVDISDFSIEVLRINKKREILGYGRTVLDEGIVLDGKIIDKEKLSLGLKNTLKKAGLANASLSSGKIKAAMSFPESKIFVRHFELSLELQGEELKKEIMNQIDKIIPSGLDNVYWEHLVVSTKKSHHILFIAALKDLIDEYIDVAHTAGLEIIIIDTEASSLGRSLLKPLFLKANSLIMDIGARTSDISIFGRDGLLHLSVSVPVAGNQLTQAIMDKLGKGKEEAEDIKRSFGFEDSKSGHQISAVLKHSFEDVLNKAKKAIHYYQNNVNGKIEEIILAGGSSSIPGLDEYIEKSLGVKVKVGNPIEKLKNGQILNKKDQSILFANVIGLALRGLDDHWRGINLLSKEMGNNAEKGKVFKYILSSFLVVLILVSFGYSGYTYFTKIYNQYNNQEAILRVSDFPSSATSTDIINNETNDTISLEEEIIIRDTPIGWLNVRKGPGTNYNKIGKVYPKESYVILEEKDNWYKIKIPASADGNEDTEGWVISDYATKQK